MEFCHLAAARRMKLWSLNANLFFKEPQQQTKIIHLMGPLKDVRAKIFQHWFFSETFTTVRWWASYVRNVKKMGGHRLRFGENMPRKTPKMWQNRASLANKASVCKPKYIAIKSLKWNLLCQILFKWTYKVNLVNWWGSLKIKFAFSDHSFTRLAVARWQDLMSREQKFWIFFNFPHWFFVHFWTTWR